MEKEITNLKRQKTKLLNNKCKTIEQFELIQDKLNEVELRLKEIR